jgi:AraC-like DNA-binding protein
VAAELGYADQSHMIAEFRELSSLTPEALATQRWFHPFILEARSRPGRIVRRRQSPSNGSARGCTGAM